MSHKFPGGALEKRIGGYSWAETQHPLQQPPRNWCICPLLFHECKVTFLHTRHNTERDKKTHTSRQQNETTNACTVYWLCSITYINDMLASMGDHMFLCASELSSIFCLCSVRYAYNYSRIRIHPWLRITIIIYACLGSLKEPWIIIKIINQ